MLKNFKTFKLAVQFYHQCQKLKLTHHLKDQLLRASSSIALNCAEGSGKRTAKDRRKYFFIAYGSIKESQAILVLADIKDPELIDLADHIGACLYKICHPK